MVVKTAIKVLPAVAFLIGCHALTVFAQDFEFQKPQRLRADGEVIDTGKNVAHSGPALADINDDGKMDLLVGNFRGYIEYFENVGTSSDPKFAKGNNLQAEGEDIRIHNW